MREDGRWRAGHGGWFYRIDLPDAADGRHRDAARYGLASQQQAEDDLELIADLLAVADVDDEIGRRRIADLIETALRAKGPLPDLAATSRRFAANAELDSTLTVATWLETWLAGRKTIRPTTRRNYASNIRIHLIPTIGHIRLNKLTVSHLDALFDAIDTRTAMIRAARTSTDPKVRAAVRGQRTVGDASKQRIRETLRSALNTAIKRGLITHNVAAHVELASGKRPKALLWTPARVARWKATRQIPSPVMVWTPAQTGWFLDHVLGEKERLYPLYHLIAYRGLRRGEACGLHWDDVDLDDTHTLTVRWQIVQIGWETVIGEPKSDAGDRVVSLDAATITALREQRAAQAAARLAQGSWPDHNLVFTEPDGQPLHPDHVTKTFNRLVGASGLPPVRLHDLRHGAATLALAAGAEMKEVQELLGHSTIVLTADTYTSVLPELAADLAENVARLVPRHPRPGTGPGRPATGTGPT